MHRHRSGRLAVAFLLVALLQALLVAAPAAASAPPTIPLPSSMAAVGDSITQAASTVSLGADSPQNSWSTGTSSTVQSHYLRLLAEGAPIEGNNINGSVSGAKMVHLAGQMANVAEAQPDYLTVLIGGNDLCTNTVGEMTSVTAFTAQFETAMATLTTGSPQTRVYVVSIPNVYQLWELYRSSFFARLVWASANICQSLLANPTSTKQADVQRRAQVYQRNVDFNAALASVCGGYAKCHFDDNAAFNTAYTRSDVSGDYFHPSVQGQAKLAAVSWTAGYRFSDSSEPPPGQNQPPTASFTYDCDDLTCSFTDTSSDPDGSVVAWTWVFGDGTTSTTQHPSHAYASAGSYSVTLTATDNSGATDAAIHVVTVSAPEPPPPAPDGISLSATGYKVKGVQHADLVWSGAAGSSVDIVLNGTKVTTVPNTGSYTHNLNQKGGGTAEFTVCDAGTETCSERVQVGF